MKALLLIAHGSRLPAANAEVEDLCRRLADRLATDFDLIEPAFLELADPGIGAAMEHCIARGCESITLLPYFLVSGRHIHMDIPAIMQEQRDRNPRLDIHMAPYLGQSGQLPEVLAALVADGPPGARGGSSGAQPD